jgi:hypothetical protein
MNAVDILNEVARLRSYHSSIRDALEYAARIAGDRVELTRQIVDAVLNDLGRAERVTDKIEGGAL